jgi:hypothetical protein
MAKLLQPAIGSIWSRKNGDQFEVTLAVHDKKACLLRATGSGRRHWVTYEGLAKKYQWISDPKPEAHELEEDIRADERVRVLKWLVKEAEQHQHNNGDEHPGQTLMNSAKWLADTLRALRDDDTGQTQALWDVSFPKGEPLPQDVPEPS